MQVFYKFEIYLIVFIWKEGSYDSLKLFLLARRAIKKEEDLSLLTVGQMMNRAQVFNRFDGHGLEMCNLQRTRNSIIWHTHTHTHI